MSPGTLSCGRPGGVWRHAGGSVLRRLRGAEFMGQGRANHHEGTPHRRCCLGRDDSPDRFQHSGDEGHDGNHAGRGSMLRKPHWRVRPAFSGRPARLMRKADLRSQYREGAQCAARPRRNNVSDPRHAAAVSKCAALPLASEDDARDDDRLIAYKDRDAFALADAPDQMHFSQPLGDRKQP